MMSLEPLKLTWQLASPIVVGAHPLHLDSLVAWAQTQEALAAMSVEEAAASKANIRELATRPLPLGREERDGKWVWQASAVRSSGPSTHAIRYWTRKTDLYDHASRVEAGQIDGRFSLPLKPHSHSPKLDTVRGPFKQQFKFYPVKSVSTVEAWCIGDKERLLELLVTHVTHVGAKGRMGHGAVVRCDIEHDPHAVHRWQERVLPWPHEGAESLQLAVHPPYWAPEHLGPAWARPELFGG
ncbi:type IV CRISPR-associated protein Csf3 [Paraburkholderia sp. SIMBA_054]|uniref:type IV CRISPR-associated protein Csf3 n=1 Tax=Paraburkholderia sp. SIMBA_054 TaxID=3085795 RepID=UPI0039797932